MYAVPAFHILCKMLYSHEGYTVVGTRYDISKTKGTFPWRKIIKCSNNIWLFVALLLKRKTLLACIENISVLGLQHKIKKLSPFYLTLKHSAISQIDALLNMKLHESFKIAQTYLSYVRFLTLFIIQYRNFLLFDTLLMLVAKK